MEQRIEQDDKVDPLLATTDRRTGKSMQVFGKRVPLPQNQWLRMLFGALLVFGGILGFLPILGVWMIPLGLVVLSIDLPVVRRRRRRFDVWWSKNVRAWKAKRAAK